MMTSITSLSHQLRITSRPKIHLIPPLPTLLVSLLYRVADPLATCLWCLSLCGKLAKTNLSSRQFQMSLPDDKPPSHYVLSFDVLSLDSKGEPILWLLASDVSPLSSFDEEDELALLNMSKLDLASQPLF